MSANIALYGLASLNMALCVLSQTALWQRKEYRIDRMRAYAYSPEKSVQDISIWSVALLLSLAAFFISWVAYLSMLVLLGGYVVRGIKRGVFRPKFTARAIIVLGLSVAFFVLLLFIIRYSALVSFITVVTPIAIAVAVGCTALLSTIKKGSVIVRAIQYRKTLHNLQAIGITGSVGKTSTKTYALHVLEKDDETILATKKHSNSPFPIAQDILSRITKKTNVYIAELAAYKKGEITELCDIVQPTIGVITAITNQHAALFGSVERLAEAKWELAEALPEHGTLILNKDDKNIVKLSKSFSGHIIWYSVREHADVAFTEIELQKNTVSCVLVTKGERSKVVIPVIGRGQLSSALAACAIAHAMGMPQRDIAKKLETLPGIERTMQQRKTGSGNLVIDDSYSASEASVMNAIEYLNTVGDENSLLVLVPIIELGDEAFAVHQKIGAALAHSKFQTFIYGTAYQDDIMAGLAGTPHLDIIWYVDPNVLKGDVLKNTTKNSLIVFEGRLPSNVIVL